MSENYKIILKRLVWHIITTNTIERNLSPSKSFAIGISWMSKIDHLPDSEVENYVKNIVSLISIMFENSKKLLIELENLKKFEPTDEDDQKYVHPDWLPSLQAIKKKMTGEEMKEYIEPVTVLRRIIMDLSVLKDILKGEET
jgi:hypothetical protein